MTIFGKAKFTTDGLVVLSTPTPVDPRTTRDKLLSEVTRVEDLGAAFDLTAYPLPMRVALHEADAGACWTCARREALHVYMRIRPRGADELPTVTRDAEGRVELNTCTEVSQRVLEEVGTAAAVEKIRLKVRDMVMHEVYEALLFRGVRIMDPHDSRLRPGDQPF